MSQKLGEKCDISFIHEDRVKSARKALHDDETTLELSDTFKILSDPTRLNIVLALAREELCVCDIAALLGMTESAISHQLRLLKNFRLVKYRKNGKMAYYSLDDEHIEDLIRIATRHVEEL
ncbi:MAG: winged helix-turn-helix transcriptional regulator [Ignavibacteriae bacterium]|nr:winged helix-turn-helix transcriptional regulator [Ignavibacteriota bacterium]